MSENDQIVGSSVDCAIVRFGGGAEAFLDQDLVIGRFAHAR
jgi:hypothetical protein